MKGDEIDHPILIFMLQLSSCVSCHSTAVSSTKKEHSSKQDTHHREADLHEEDQDRRDYDPHHIEIGRRGPRGRERCQLFLQLRYSAFHVITA